MIKFDTQGKFFLEEPGLDKSSDNVFPLGAKLHAQTELLAATHKSRRMKQIEVALLELSNNHDGIHGTEGRAHRERAGVFLFDANHQVFPSGYWRIGGLRPGIDFSRLEEIKAFDALFADLDADHVEILARRNSQFATNHPVLGMGVSANLNLLDFVFRAFIDLKLEIDRPGFCIGNLDNVQIARSGCDINVTARPIKILDGFGIPGQSFDGEDVSGIHLEAG